MIKWLGNWHPQARIAMLFVLAFFALQVCYLIMVLTIPTTLNSGFATFLLIFTPIWFLTATIATFYLLYNALSLQNRANQRHNYTETRNLVVAWLGPLLLSLLIFIWFFTPLVSTVFEIRRDWNFQRSRDEMLNICDTVLDEGARSDILSEYTDVGVFTLVRVSLRNNGQEVWFDVGDTSGEIGYICLATEETTLQDNETYTFERVDERFYFYRERDNVRLERQQNDDE